MKKTTFIICLCFIIIFIAINIYAENTEDRTLVEKDSKFGYTDMAGALVIDIVYDSAGNFENGIAIVEKNGYWGVIDIDGNAAVDFLYTYIGSFSDGKAIAQKDGVMGILDINGVFLGLPYKYLSSVKNGYIFAGLDEVNGKSHGDRIELSDIYIDVPSIQDKIAFITGKFGFIDTDGNVVYPFELEAEQNEELIGISMTGARFQVIFYANYINEDGIAFVKQDSNGKYGIINTTGELIYGFEIDKYHAFRKCYIGKIEQQWVFFDKQGREIRSNIVAMAI